jgi:hypothetical protein
MRIEILGDEEHLVGGDGYDHGRYQQCCVFHDHGRQNMPKKQSSDDGAGL